jgi:glucose/arabinose dehydrogenase
MDHTLNRRTLAKTASALAGGTAIGNITPALAQDATPAPAFPVVELPEGYQIEKVLEGLTYPTALTWDDQGNMYVAEAGGAFMDLGAPSRILQIADGQAIEVANLTQLMGPIASVVGLYWYNGAFYFTHRDPNDRTGAVSRLTSDGAVTPLISGIIDNQSEHQINDIRLEPDGRMYVASGPAGNAAVMGLDVAPFIMLNPDLHTRPAQDIVLTGRNYMTPDFRTEDPSDTVATGAYVPFGIETTAGQVIEGTIKCGGAILVFEPENENPEGTLAVHAWGFATSLAWFGTPTALCMPR